MLVEELHKLSENCSNHSADIEELEAGVELEECDPVETPVVAVEIGEAGDLV